MNVNRKMSTSELQREKMAARDDYRFYIRAYRILSKNHKSKHKIIKDIKRDIHRIELRYQIINELLSNR